MAESQIKRRKTAESRPSYGSPTKASLARYNPNLLPAARSSPSRGSIGKTTGASGDILSHVLGAKAKKSTPRPTKRSRDTTSDLPASDLNNEQQDAAVVIEEDDEDVIPEMQTPTIEGGRFRGEFGEDDDLPDTPQHLRERPEYQDSPPRGILSASAKRKRRKPDKPAITRSSTSPVQTVRAKVHVEPVIPSISAEEKIQLREKQQELVKLKKQLQDLKSDTTQLEQHAKQIQQLSGGQEYDRTSSLISLINRTNSSKTSEESENNALPVSTLLTSFLPFSIPVTVPAEHRNESPVPSHAPLPNLPKLLNLFTPLIITTTLSPPSRPSKPTLQVEQIHTITLAIPSLFSCTIAMTVLTNPPPETTSSVKSVGVEYISPWAYQEIGSWLRSRADEGDAQGIGYGLGRYWDMNIKRAQAWARLADDYPNLSPRAVGALRGSVVGLKGASQVKNKKRRKADGGELDIETLKQYLGRETLVCSDGVCETRITWRLGFDLTSEIESKVDLRLVFARAGAEIVEQKTLRQNARDSFNLLLEKQGVSFSAMKVLNAIYT